MGLFDNLESKLSSMVNGAFAKAFKSSVQPVEIASAIRTAMDDKAAVVGRGRTIVPNLYTIHLSPSDFEQLSAYSDGLTDELVAAAEEHADGQRYHPAGPLHVVLAQDPHLETGVFKLRPASAKDPYAASAPAPAPVDRDRRPSTYRPVEAEPQGRRPGLYEDRAPAYLDADEAEPQPGPAPVRPAPRRDDEELGETAVQHVVEPSRPARPQSDPTRRPWLDVDGDRYPLLSAVTVVGRDGVADIVLDDPGISRKHAELRVTADGPHFVVTIRDLGSTNGTFVEGHRITSQRLADGERVTIGRTSFTLRLGKA